MTHRIPHKLLVTAAVFLALWFSLRFLLPLLLPFLFALFLALAAEPLVRVFARRCRMPRWLAAGLGVCIALVLVNSRLGNEPVLPLLASTFLRITYQFPLVLF